jgi:hypothetical protein
VTNTDELKTPSSKSASVAYQHLPRYPSSFDKFPIHAPSHPIGLLGTRLIDTSSPTYTKFISATTHRTAEPLVPIAEAPLSTIKWVLLREALTHGGRHFGRGRCNSCNNVWVWERCDDDDDDDNVGCELLLFAPFNAAVMRIYNSHSRLASLSINQKQNSSQAP